MKKEKTIRSYQRKTKSGKVVTVKQHTAKYDAADEMKKALQKRGAGKELESKLTADELKQVKGIVEENSELDEKYVAAFYPELSPKMVKAVMTEYRKKSATPQAKANNTAGKTLPAPKSPKTSDPDLSFTKDEYKAWYHWDMENDPKNKAALHVKQVLTKKFGAKGYKQYEKEMTDSYTSRGHIKGYSGFEKMDSAVASKTAGDAKAPKRPSKGKELSPKKPQAKVKELNLGGHSYFVWKDSDGSFKGSRQNPTSRMMDANSIARFTYDQGFKSVKDVEDYLKAPYTKGKKKK